MVVQETWHIFPNISPRYEILITFLEGFDSVVTAQNERPCSKWTVQNELIASISKAAFLISCDYTK
jgi:hypothetical protein